MDLGLEGRGAVVLASTGGLGLAVARALVAEGVRVAVSGRDPERLERARSELATLGGPGAVLAEALDVTDGAALERHLVAARTRFGAVDVLVLNAGGPPPGSAAGVGDAELERAFRLTFLSAVRAARAVVPWMRERGFGRIVGLTSIAVREPIADLVGSNAMRAGLTGYLKTLAGEVAADGITVNTVCTGLFATDRLETLFRARAAKSGRTLEEERAAAMAGVPVGRPGIPDELAALVAFLASERAGYVTGAALPIDGGASRGLL